MGRGGRAVKALCGPGMQAAYKAAIISKLHACAVSSSLQARSHSRWLLKFCHLCHCVSYVCRSLRSVRVVVRFRSELRRLRSTVKRLLTRIGLKELEAMQQEQVRMLQPEYELCVRSARAAWIKCNENACDVRCKIC